MGWLAHIRSRGYNVTRFELTNEAYSQLPVDEYAAAVADWAPALKAALPGALLGASGPSSGDAKGKEVRLWGTALQSFCMLLKHPRVS